MEEQQLQEPALLPEEEQPLYTPRPAWQVWTARIGLAAFLIILAIYYLNIAGGGL